MSPTGAASIVSLRRQLTDCSNREGIVMNDLTPAALTGWPTITESSPLRTARRRRRSFDGRSARSRRMSLRVAHKGRLRPGCDAGRRLEHRCVVLEPRPTGRLRRLGRPRVRCSTSRRMPPTSALNFACRHGVHLPSEPGVAGSSDASAAVARLAAPGTTASHRDRRSAGLRSSGRSAGRSITFGRSATARSMACARAELVRRRTAVPPGATGSTRFGQTCVGSMRCAPAQSHPEVGPRRSAGWRARAGRAQSECCTWR